MVMKFITKTALLLTITLPVALTVATTGNPAEAACQFKFQNCGQGGHRAINSGNHGRQIGLIRGGTRPTAPVHDGHCGANAFRATIVGNWGEPSGESRFRPSAIAGYIGRRCIIMSQFELILTRKTHCNVRLGQLRQRLTDVKELKPFPRLTFYVAGSYARGEASNYSDIDPFFVYNGPRKDLPKYRTDHYRLFAAIIEAIDELKFPAFSGYGKFLDILFIDDILQHLGGRQDDYMNYFTARMLLLLESVPIINNDDYNDIVSKVVMSYFRDYDTHRTDFRPTFLVNDIIRFWKTLCLNYEYERNVPPFSDEDQLEHTAQNFKLKFSRMLTCYSTVIALSSHEEPITPNALIELTKIPPRERLERVREAVIGSGTYIDKILNQYIWFLEKTGLSKEELHNYLADHDNHASAFRKADEFGYAMFNLLSYCAERQKYMRYIVI